MKNSKTGFLALAIITGIMIITAACSIDSKDDKYCFDQYTSPIDAVSGPDTTTVNVPITLNATFTIQNSCGTFNTFVTTPGYPKQISAFVNYAGCACSQVAAIVTQPYTFTAPAAGTYELQFITGNTTAPIVKTITVSQ